VKYSNGFSIQITPKVDDVELDPQAFSQQGSGTFPCEAYVVARGAKLSARVQQLTRTGDLELVNIKAAFKPMREVPVMAVTTTLNAFPRPYGSIDPGLRWCSRK
jgi:hypothetical protein